MRLCTWMLRPARVVTGCMCAAVSCQATQMGVMLEKKKTTHSPYRHVTILQLNRPHYFTVGFMWKCLLSRAAVHAHSAAPLTAMMNCVPKCVCLCV